MLQLANETHKQKQAKQKMKDAQRSMGGKKIVVYSANTRSVKGK